MFNPLRSISNKTVQKHLCNPRIPKEIVLLAPGYINNNRLKSEVSITLHCRLCSTRYTAVQIKELFEKCLCYQNSYYDKYGRFLLQREAITCYC